MIIAIDFDGTCVSHDYPRIGKDIGAVPILQKLVKNGHKLMLWTMRGTRPTDNNGIETLKEAVEWFNTNNIPLWGINENPEQKESGWSNSHKQYAQLYIDDAALGCPLMYDPDISDRVFVNWEAVEELLKYNSII